MSTIERSPCTISAELLASMEATARQARVPDRDPAVMKRVREQMDQLREAIREREGTLDLGVSAIREFRDR